MSPHYITELMKVALGEAEKAASIGEVPIGAVISDGSDIIFKCHNQVEALQDPTAHAEVLAIREASKILGNWRLKDLILCVTVEPCTMCLGAIKQSRIATVVFGAWDAKAGACGSIYDLSIDSRSGLVPRVISGVLSEECGSIVSKFFQERRRETTFKSASVLPSSIL